MPNCHAIVWIDSREARVWRFGSADIEQRRLKADAPYLAVKHKVGSMQTGNLAADLALLDRIIDALRGIRTWSLTGPGGARHYLLGYLEQYNNRDAHIAHLLVQLTGVSEMAQLTDTVLDEQARSRAAA